MSTNKPITVLLLEDNENDCNEFRNFAKSRDDVCIVCATNSVTEALKQMVIYLPEVVIVDIELDNGEGSGIVFLEKLKEISLEIKPIRIITTNLQSEVVDNYAHLGNADMIFHKKKENYSIELIFENIIALRKTLFSIKPGIEKEKINKETQAIHLERVANKINTELDLIGISGHLVGRKYLYDAIYYLLTEKNEETSVFYHLAKIYKKCNSAICRSMQTAIYRAWRTSPIEEIEIYYTAKYDYERGVPTPTQFLFYYVDKIKKQLG